MKAWLLSMKWRTILAGVLTVALPLAGLSAFVHFAVTAALEERVIKETGWFSAIAADIIEERLRGDINLGKLFVTRPLLLAGLRRGDEQELSRHLKILVGSAPSLERAFITSSGGILLADYPVDRKVHGRDFSDRDWYKGTAKSWKPYVSEFYLRAAKPRRYLFAIAVPIKAGNEITGILVMQPKTDYVKDALSGVDIGVGHVYAVDKKGRLIYHPYHPLDNMIDFSGVSAVQKVMQGRNGIEEMIDPVDKAPVFSAYRPVKDWGWGVVVDKPASVVLAPVRKITFWLAAVAGLLLLLGGFFSYRVANLLIANKALLEERERLFNFSLDLLCIAGFDGYFKQLNPAWQAALGWTNEELMSKPFLEFVHPEDREPTVKAAGSLAEGATIPTFDNRYRCKDGSYKWLSWSSFPILKDKLIFAVAHDITERKKLEQDLRERSAQLAEANRGLQAMNEEQQAMNEELQTQQKELFGANIRLAEASRAKSDFLANMSHELRTPLNSILGFSEILHDEMYGPLSELQKEYVSHINGSGKHLLGLINDILDLSKVESGRMELNVTRFSLKEVLNGALVMVREKAMKHGINLGLDVEPAADREVECDERKLKQILFNLLSNAVKFTPDGGAVRVAARLTKDEGRGTRDEQEESSIVRAGEARGRPSSVEISVADTGIGIKPEDMGKLFQEFTQLESPYSKGYEGTGLGLALTKRLVELLGGNIRAESAWERGSTFTFILPVKHSEESPLPAAAGRKKTAAPPDRKRALIIDDDPLTLQLVVAALTTEGYEVHTASNGKEGIEAARRKPPGLIVLDLMMPGMSGFEVADALSSDERTADIPVVVLTAMSISSENKKRLEKNVERIIEKGGLSRNGFIAEVKKAAKKSG